MTLDVRVAAQAAEATVGHLEWRAAETTADLERRVDDFEAQKRTIEDALMVVGQQNARSSH